MKRLKDEDGVLVAGGSLLKNERNLINPSVEEYVEAKASKIGLPMRSYSIGGSETNCSIDAQKVYCLGLAQQLSRLDSTDSRVQEKQLELKARYEILVAETGSDELDIGPFLN